jgi:excisionase family DNA binding protein
MRAPKENTGGQTGQAFSSQQETAAILVAMDSLNEPKVINATPETPAAVLATAPMFGLTEAALVLGCHPRTVRELLRRGLLPGRLLVGRWKIRRDDLEAFIEASPRARNESRAATPAARSAER